MTHRLIIKIEGDDAYRSLLHLNIPGIELSHYHSIIQQIFSVFNLDISSALKNITALPNLSILKCVPPQIDRTFSYEEIEKLKYYTANLAMQILASVNELNILSYYSDIGFSRLEYYVENINGNYIYLVRM